MRNLLILAVVIVLCLIVAFPAPAETTTEDNGVTVINGDVLASPKTSRATIAFIESEQGMLLSTPARGHGTSGITPIAD